MKRGMSECPFCLVELESTEFKSQRAFSCRNRGCNSKFAVIDEDNFLLYLPVEMGGRKITFDINISIKEPQFTAFRLWDDPKLEDVFLLKKGLNPFYKSELAEIGRLAGRVAMGILFK